MAWFYIILYFIVAVFLSIAIGRILDKFIRRRLLAAINLVIPDYTPIIGKKISDDPYVNSVLNDSRVNNDIDKIKNAIAKFLSLIFSLIFVFFISSMLFSDRKTLTDSKGNPKEHFFPKSLEDFFEKIVVQLGPFGDLFNGSLTPFLTFATFSGLLITIIMQHMQMRATLAELQMSRIEMSESTDALQTQAINSEAQKLDNNFYSMLENFKNSIDEINEAHSGGVNQKITVKHEIHVFNMMNSGSMDDAEIKKYWKEVKEDFLGIFLVHYQILKYLDEYDNKVIDSEEKKRYANILRATTPHRIQFLIFVNCALGDFYIYRSFLEKYQIFEHLYFDNFNFHLFKLLVARYQIIAYGDKVRLKSYLYLKSNDVNDLLYGSVFYLRRFRAAIKNKFNDYSLTQPFEGRSELIIEEFNKNLMDFIGRENFDIKEFIVSDELILKKFLQDKYCGHLLRSLNFDFSTFKQSKYKIKELFDSMNNIQK